MATDFHRQHAIITGGSSGIGKAVACRLARDGARVSLIARDPARLEAARAEVQAGCAGQSVAVFPADVAVCAQAEAAVAAAIACHGPPDILVASAGIVQPGYFEQLPLSSFERTMQVDYFGTLHVVRAVLPAMRAQRSGHLVLVSSGAGLQGVFGYASYCPAKFAVNGLAEVLRAELKPAGIAVSVVYPPDTDTPQLVAERPLRPAETVAIAGMSSLWSADAVAGSIVDGIRRRSFRITPGLEMTLLCRLHSLFGPFLERYLDRLIARVQRDRPPPEH